MSKILLVEDDNNLREIYEARLQAEGYDIVSARDGEEALTVAMKERPDLIISDVMMPKISGFDMLDIIRSTEETKNAKVIMMTALSQAEDKERASKLGADRYLVKSQVTLEDVAKVAREVLNGDSAQPASESSEKPEVPAVAAAPTTEPSTPTVPDVPTVPAPAAEPAAVVAPIPATPAVQQTAGATTVAPAEPQSAAQADSPALSAISPTTSDDTAADDPIKTPEDEESAIAAQIESFIDTKKTEPEPDTKAEIKVESTPEPEVKEEPKEPTKEEQVAAEAKVTGKKVISPISDPTASKGPDLENLLKKEVEKDQMAEIAKSVASENSNVAEELTAEAALRSAARDLEKQPATETEAGAAPQVAISENGDLKVQSPPEENATTEESPLTVVATPAAPETAEPSPATPPVTTQPTTAPTPAAPVQEQKPDTVDPNSIAL